MIQLYPMRTDQEWQWFAQRTYTIRQEDTQGIVAYRDGVLCAAVVFDTLTPVACTVHIALDDPWAIKHGLFHEVAHHAFVTLGKSRMFGLVPSSNEKALKLDRNIGFKEVARVPNSMAEGVDTVILCLEKHNCRFLDMEHRRAA